MEEPEDKGREEEEPIGWTEPPADTFAWVDVRLRMLGGFFRFLRVSCDPWPRMPLGARLRAFLRGFPPGSAALYRLRASPPGEYLSDFACLLFGPRVNGVGDHIVNNKAVFPLLMRAVGLPAPRMLGYLEGGRYRGAGSCDPLDPVGWVIESVRANGGLVIKPVKGRKGLGLLFLSEQGGRLLVNGGSASRERLSRLLSRPGRFVATAFVEQAEYAARLYPRTTNTVRLFTLWDDSAGEPFVAAAAQRIGTRRSFPVDNFRGGRGGLSAEVGAGGVLGPAAALSEEGHLVRHPRHPETDAPIEGVVIPRWEATVARILRGARELGFAPGLAWDVAWTRDAFQVLELNGNPGLFLHQVHRPLLRDPRVREFYRRRGVPCRP